METKKVKSNRALLFFKKNIYLILMIMCILAIGTLITLTAINKAKNNNGNPVDTILDANGNPINNNAGDKINDVNNNNNGDNLIVELVFALPIEGEVIKGYTDTELVYNSTMRHWSTHQGIDYAAPLSTAVMAVESGTVSSISTTTLRGTTVMIKHKNGFDSAYSLLGTDVEVSVGQEVAKGDIIGYISEKGVFEIADGPHLHFELRLNNELVDPTLYFEEANK